MLYKINSAKWDRIVEIRYVGEMRTSTNRGIVENNRTILDNGEHNIMMIILSERVPENFGPSGNAIDNMVLIIEI